MKILNTQQIIGIGTALLIGLALSGCMSQKELMIKDGYPLAYATGFEDGCHSGKKAGGNMFEHFKKDVNAFNTSKDYAQGWSDAFRECETEAEALQRQTRMSMEQQRLTETKRHDKAIEQNHMLDNVDTSGLGNLK